MSTAALRRERSGPALFSFGFRPFFLFGAVWAALAVPIWVWSFLGGGAPLAHRDWHVHEMLFGFLPAVLAGFLTTAIPSWTARPPVAGGRLAGLAVLWCAGRVATFAAYWLGPTAAVVDAGFLLVFAAVVWREILAAGNWRNVPVCVLVSLFALANVVFHLDMAVWRTGVGERMAIGVVALLIALIGGRIIPSFTTNWMKARALAPLPVPFSTLDTVVLGLTAAGGLAWTAVPQSAVTGALLTAAGAGNLLRLARWEGSRTLAEPLLWSLHTGYAWLGAGLFLLGASRLEPLIPQTAGIHALTAGAVGAMTLAVMTRATRGHTGRPLAADRTTTAIYLAVNAAAALRVAAPFFGAAQPGLLVASAALWSLAFAGFAAAYGPMLTQPRPADA